MEQYLWVLAMAGMPVAGNFFGGLISEMMRVSGRTYSLALHASAGVVLGVVGVELMPRALQAHPPWMIILAFVLGGCFSVVVGRGVEALENRLGPDGVGSSWMIYFGTAVDLFSDGLMIGTGSILSSSLGFLLALGQVPADIPEGFAVMTSFRKRGVSRTRRMIYSALLAVPIFLGTTVGYWAVRGRSEVLKLSLLAFTAGVLVTIAVEEMVTQAHEATPEREAGDAVEALVLVGGFALFALLSAYLG